MREWVLVVKEDVCIANGKDPEAANLLETMKLWGEVKPLDNVVASIRAEYQGTIDNLRKQLDDMKDHDLTQDELVWLNFIRQRKDIETRGLYEQIAARDKVIDEVRTDSQKRAEQLALFAEQLREMAM